MRDANSEWARKRQGHTQEKTDGLRLAKAAGSMQSATSVFASVSPIDVDSGLPQQPIQLKDDAGLGCSPQACVDGGAGLSLHSTQALNKLPDAYWQLQLKLRSQQGPKLAHTLIMSSCSFALALGFETTQKP